MIITASLPPNFLVEAVSVSTYLINIQPSTNLQGGIPLERLTSRSPDYSALRLFGCICYVLLAPHECTRLIVQSVECVFLVTVMGIRVISVGIHLVVGCIFLGI
jgi:hypothetical protein